MKQLLAGIFNGTRLSRWDVTSLVMWNRST